MGRGLTSWRPGWYTCRHCPPGDVRRPAISPNVPCDVCSSLGGVTRRATAAQLDAPAKDRLSDEEKRRRIEAYAERAEAGLPLFDPPLTPWASDAPRRPNAPPRLRAGRCDPRPSDTPKVLPVDADTSGLVSAESVPGTRGEVAAAAKRLGVERYMVRVVSTLPPGHPDFVYEQRHLYLTPEGADLVRAELAKPKARRRRKAGAA